MTRRILSVSRRDLLAAFLVAAVRPGRADDERVVVPGKRSLILHNDRPEDLETPLHDYDSWLTPVDAFFVRQHLPRPSPIDAAAYRLTVNGLVSKPLRLSLDDLKLLP